MASWITNSVSNDVSSRHKWVSEAEHQVELLSQLPKGWDSDGADPPEAPAVLAAQALIHSLAQFEWAAPTAVTATRSGGIQFEWDTQLGPYFELECIDRDTAEYFFQDPERKEEVEGIVRSGKDIDTIASYVKRTKRLV
jgi:hypothetical protein